MKEDEEPAGAPLYSNEEVPDAAERGAELVHRHRSRMRITILVLTAIAGLLIGVTVLYLRLTIEGFLAGFLAAMLLVMVGALLAQSRNSQCVGYTPLRVYANGISLPAQITDGSEADPNGRFLPFETILRIEYGRAGYTIRRTHDRVAQLHDRFVFDHDRFEMVLRAVAAKSNPKLKIETDRRTAN